MVFQGGAVGPLVLFGRGGGGCGCLFLLGACETLVSLFQGAGGFVLEACFMLEGEGVVGPFVLDGVRGQMLELMLFT